MFTHQSTFEKKIVLMFHAKYDTCALHVDRGIFIAFDIASVVYTLSHQLVAGGLGERGGGETDTVVGSVEDRVEALEESETVDEVETFTAVGAEIGDDEEDATGSATDISVEVTRPDLSISSKLEGGCTSDEEQTLQVVELGGGDTEQASGVVNNTAGGSLVLVESVGGEENESGTGIDNAGSGC